jgi:hypothetical protein
MISNAPTAGVVKVIDFGLSMALPPVAGALLPPNGRGAVCTTLVYFHDIVSIICIPYFAVCSGKREVHGT